MSGAELGVRLATAVKQSTDPRCVTCRAGFDFPADQQPEILRHVAYGFGLAHAGACVSEALEAIFVEPGYDCAAYGRDVRRKCVRSLRRAGDWAAVVRGEPFNSGQCPLVYEPLTFWATVEHFDGSLREEGVIWDVEWRDEPGALEFVEARDACGGPQLYCARRSVSDSAVAANHNDEESGTTPAPARIGLAPGDHHSLGVNSDTDFGVPPWQASVQKPMFVIERSSTMARSIGRFVSAVALACLPALILILSAAPMCGNGGCLGDDLSPPPPAIVVSLP